MRFEARGYTVVASALLLAFVLAACGPSAQDDTFTTESGLQYIEIEEGDGPTPQEGEIVSVHYSGTLEDGTEFDNSYNRGEPIQFPLGRGRPTYRISSTSNPTIVRRCAKSSIGSFISTYSFNHEIGTSIVHSKPLILENRLWFS